MPTPTPIYPLNDFAMFAKLKDINNTTGAVTPLTTGTVAAFISDASGPDAVTVDATLSTSAIHVAGGKWLVFLDASVLTVELLDEHFAEATPYLIVQQADGFRVYHELAYTAAREAV